MGRGPRVLKYEYEYADAAARFARACRGDVARDRCPSAAFRVVCRASFALPRDSPAAETARVDSPRGRIPPGIDIAGPCDAAARHCAR